MFLICYQTDAGESAKRRTTWGGSTMLAEESRNISTAESPGRQNVKKPLLLIFLICTISFISFVELKDLSFKKINGFADKKMDAHFVDKSFS